MNEGLNNNSIENKNTGIFAIDKIEFTKLMDHWHIKNYVGERIKTIELKNGIILEAGMPVSELLEKMHIPSHDDLVDSENYLALSLYYTMGANFSDGKNSGSFIEITISGGKASDSAKRFLNEDEKVQKTDMADRELNVMLKAIVLSSEGEDLDSLSKNLGNKKIDSFVKDYNYPWAKTLGGKKSR